MADPSFYPSKGTYSDYSMIDGLAKNRASCEESGFAAGMPAFV